MSAAAQDRSLLDLTASRAVPEFFAVATAMMASYLAVMLIWPSSRSHEFAPLITLTLNTALAAAGWKIKALHTRRYLAGYWLFLGACAYIGILQTHSSVDSMLTGSAVVCTVMAAQLLGPTPAKLSWAVLATALLGLYAAEHQGWVTVQHREPLQGVTMGLALLVLGILQARLFNRAGQETSRMLLEREQQARTAAEETSRAKSDFLSVMSHEIRTPLNGIVGLATLVQDPKLDEANRRQYLHMLSQSSQALSSLVTGVLDFSKMEADRMELLHEPFSLRRWAQDLDNSFSAAAAIKGLYLQVDVDPSAGDGTLGDAARLRQIAANYISNAIKFTKAGTIRVRISRPRGDDLLRLEVRDSGIGLADSAQQRLFKPFQQGDARVHREFGGTGLGLSICERLAHLMNGAVGVNSTPGMGSTFWAEVHVPPDAAGDQATPDPHERRDHTMVETASDGDADARFATQSPDSVEHGTAFRLPHVDLDAARVLVVDDNAINRTITSQMLRRMNAIVATARDGHECLDALRLAQSEGWPFDMVLMDVQMPGMDGLTAVGLIRQDALLASTPVVALTAGVLKDDVTRAIEAGMDGFLAKPVTAEQLARNVAHFADMGRQRRSDGSRLQF
jgi:signal transduction histidine kinase/ActR/RegA family two-component response regulator